MSLLDDYISEQRRLAVESVNRQVDVQAEQAKAQVEQIGDKLVGGMFVGVGLLAVYLGRSMLARQ